MPKPLVASYCTTFLKAEMLHIYRQVTGLQDFETFVLAKERRNEARFPFQDIELLPTPRSNFIRRFWLKYIRHASPILYRGEYQVLHKVLGRRNPDLMHIYFGHTAVHLLPFIEIWDKPCIVSFHGADVMLREEQPGYADKMRAMLQRVELVLVRSNSLRDRLQAIGCPEAKIRMNRTGIPLDHFPRIERSYPSAGDWHFVQACRLISKKGLGTTLRAFAQFHRTHPAARLSIAGEGPMLVELQRMATELGIGEAVRFRGFLAQSELVELYGSAHAFLHPSELTADNNQEGIPNSMLEAMSTGLPVLATLHGGIPEAVEHGRSGLLVEERNAEALYAVMGELTPIRWQEMSRFASESMESNFEQKAQIRALEASYTEAMQR